MTTLLTKSKLISLGICLLIIILTSVLFVYTDNKIDNKALQTSLIQFEKFETVYTEDFYREKIDNYEDSIIVLKKDANIHFISLDLEEMLSYPKNDLLKKNLFQFIHPKDLPFFANNLIEVIQENEISTGIGPFRIVDNNSNYNLFMADAYPLGNNESEFSGIGLVLKDITLPLGK